jgi:arylsulfatase A-like enzyme
MMPSLVPCLFFLQVLSVITLASGQEGSKPNVLVVMTDEHNLRTIGKYRELLKATEGEDQAYVWGPGVEVLTQNLDSLAEDGAMFSNFYTSSPVCTMSRGSFISGTYPSTNGATGNSVAMKSDALSFAEPMRNAGYRTGYIGKVCPIYDSLYDFRKMIYLR